VPPSAATASATELIIGKWLKARNNRDKVIIATKVASFFPGLERNWITAHRWGHTGDSPA
jgi:aryl-alcohol dehydrogenase-like predicted oxidoreductase